MLMWRMVVTLLRILASLRQRAMRSTPQKNYNSAMSDDKFRVIRETKVGTLDGSMRTEWDRLSAAQIKLVKMQEEHEQALDAFWSALQRQFGHFAEMHEGTQSFRVSEEGDVYIDHCVCPVCQAAVHGMTVADTVEEMYRTDLIPHEAIEHVRARAKQVDKQQETRKKMLN